MFAFQVNAGYESKEFLMKVKKKNSDPGREVETEQSSGFMLMETTWHEWQIPKKGRVDRKEKGLQVHPLGNPEF